MDYKTIFLQFIESLKEEELLLVGSSNRDICWDGKEFYLHAHGVKNPWNDPIIFDSTSGEGSFDATSALNDFSEVINDAMIQYE